jgi:hypothetical protein
LLRFLLQTTQCKCYHHQCLLRRQRRQTPLAPLSSR